MTFMAKDVAQWMVDELKQKKFLYQETTVYSIKKKFGKDFVYTNVNGNLSIGKNINKAMVAGGYAWAYREYMTDNEYASLETTARSNTTGLWSQPNPTYPSDFRRMGRGENTAPVQTQQIEKTVAPTVTNSGASCGSKRYCKQMATCAEARHYLNDCGVSRLDRDGDGVPCESICN